MASRAAHFSTRKHRRRQACRWHGPADLAGVSLEDDAFTASPERYRAPLHEKVDYLPGMSSWDKKVLLAKTSYKDYLLKYVKITLDAIPFMQTETYASTASALTPFLLAISLAWATRDLRAWIFPDRQDQAWARKSPSRRRRALHFSFSRRQRFHRAPAGALADSRVRTGPYDGRYRHGQARLRHIG